VSKRLYLTYLAQVKQIMTCMSASLSDCERQKLKFALTIPRFLRIKLSWLIMVLRKGVVIIGIVRAAGRCVQGKSMGAWWRGSVFSRHNTHCIC